MRRAALLVVAVVVGCPAWSAAQPFPEKDLPPVLRAWSAWVRDENPERACPAVHGSAVCLWPGRLALRLAGTGGTFGLEAYADRALELRLPGDAQRWPQDVTMDGRPVVVVEHEGEPVVRLPSGGHRIAGRFTWTHLPDSLPVPPSLALVDLAVEGRPVPRPRRDEAGLVWLRAEGESATSAESLRLQAFRRIADGIPLWVETHLSVEVSGKAREIELPGALLPGTVPVAVSGDLPARVDSSGGLRVQVRAGTFGVVVLARLEDRPSVIARGPAALPWPSREVWVFAADERLRQVELSGLSPIDPSRTELPDAWRKLPAFLAEPGARLALKEMRRGETDPPPDRIVLRREMWLDLGGRGFTVRDRFSGALSHTWRFDVQRPAELGRVSVDSVEQLITAHPATQAPGVELRRGGLNLEADSRLPRSGALRAVGWSVDVEQLGATLHVPPGWSLFAATGVDGASGAWTGRWTLLGFFFVLIVALAAARLFGRGWGVVALAAVVFSYEEPAAPFLVWLSLLGAAALLAVAPEGWLRRLARIWRGVSLVVLALVLLPFIRSQVTTALYPQVPAVEGGGGGLADISGLFMARREYAPPPPPATMAAPMSEPQLELGRVDRVGDARQQQAVPGGVAGGVVGGEGAPMPETPAATAPPEEGKTTAAFSLQSSVASSKANLAASNVALEQDPRAVVQTGPGVPTWSWRSYGLSWSGPVKGEQRLRLWLISPNMNRFLTLVRLGLVLLLALRLLVDGSPLRSTTAPSAAMAAAVALAVLVLGARPAAAQEAIPDRELLDELKKRLSRDAPCQPGCLSTSALHIALREGTLAFTAEVHAGDAGAWAIPGPPSSWTPAQVRVDGQPASSLARLGDSFLYVRLAPGVHRIEVSGPVPPADTLTLQLRDRPRRADGDTPGWDVAGLRADGPPDASIQLSRRLRAGERAREETGAYAPWLEITRTLSLGLTWRVRTEVRRVSPPGSPVSLRVPLLAQEAPTEADLQTEDGIALVSLARDQMDAGWSSTLPVSDALALKAPEGQPWSEVWRLECGVIWECDTQGLAPIGLQRGGLLVPEFRPWSGESLALRFRHPQAVAGQTVTLEAASLATTPGERLTTSTLTVTAHASREEALVLTLPRDAEVQELTVGGAVRPAKPDEGRLRVTLPPGSQTVFVRWREPRGARLYQRVPTVAFPVPAVNVETVLHLPDNRWLLFTRGPSWGPAVLFWGYLAFALLVALGLGLLAETPLSIRHWLLLALGLTQTDALGALVVVGLFLALAWRARRPRASALAHDALQLLLVVWVVAALLILYGVIEQGLLLRPDMQVAGAGSDNNTLRWYADRVEHATPAAGVVSLPLWIYRGLMLAWALWLAASLVRWAGWSWRAMGEGGLWRPLPRPGKAASPAAEPLSTDTGGAEP